MNYLEDFGAGQTFGSRTMTLDDTAIKAFAAAFDPQPFHLDEEAARASVFKGLAASGWHTAALTMRMLVESDLKPVGGIVGISIEGLTWLSPVRPGDTLQVDSEVLETRPYKSRSNYGQLRLKSATLNQNGEMVQILLANLLVPRRL